MVEEACICDELPAHDHFMGHAQDERGVWGPVFDHNDIGRVWVNWKAVAKALMFDGQVPDA